MQNSIKISVIVPVYKAEKYIDRCISSLIEQTCSDFEVLLIDDGSPDRSGIICEKYSTERYNIKCFHKKNGGVASARQYGVDKAVGEYIIHVDPDDWVEKNMLHELYSNAKNNDADMVICDYFVNDGLQEKYCAQRPSKLDHETLLNELFSHLYGSCWNKLIRKSCIDKYGLKFNENLTIKEDLFYNCSLLVHDIKVSYLPKAFYHYDVSINSNALTKTRSIQLLHQQQVFIDLVVPLLRDNNFNKLADTAITITAYEAFIYNLLRGEEYSRKYGVFIPNFLKSNTTFKKKIFTVFSALGMERFCHYIYKHFKQILQ